MPKKALKAKIKNLKGGACALSGAVLPLPDDPSLYDTHRHVPKMLGGTYTEENTVLADPVAHMADHGNLRERAEPLEILKSLVDDRTQTMKLALKINNQLLAYRRRTDHVNPETDAFLEQQLAPVEARLAQTDRIIAKTIKTYDDPLAKAALQVMGLGPITVAALLVYVDLEKAATPSSLWKYCGLDKASHERYTKGEKGGGNKTLRTVLWNAANVMMKLGEGGYRGIYDRTKARLAASSKAVQTRDTKGKLVTLPWSETKPCHRHGAALRAIMKAILVDYWVVGRRLRGLPTTTIYAQGMLGHTHIESPTDHGWPED